jgi:hypothetical protein
MEQYYQTLPLNDIELGYLQYIYRQRLKNFLPPFTGFSAIALFFTYQVTSWGDDSGDVLSFIPQFLFVSLFFWGPVLLFGGLIYYKRVYVFKLDVKNGLKQLIPYVIKEKEYFYRTHKFYFRIDDPDNLHYEVDEEKYHRYREGDTIYVSRAPRSKYTFEYGGRFSLM